MQKIDIDDIIRKIVLSLAEEDSEEGRQWRNVVNAFIQLQEENSRGDVNEDSIYKQGRYGK